MVDNNHIFLIVNYIMGICASANYNIEQLKKKIDEFNENISNGNINLIEIIDLLTQAYLFYDQLSRKYKNKVKYINNAYHSNRLEKNRLNSELFKIPNPPNSERISE